MIFFFGMSTLHPSLASLAALFDAQLASRTIFANLHMYVHPTPYSPQYTARCKPPCLLDMIMISSIHS